MTMTDKSITRHFGRNIFAGTASQVCLIFVAFVTTPILIAGLGKTDYGLWIVVNAFGSWIGFITLALSNCSIRFIAQAIGSGDSSQALEAHRAIKFWALILAVVGFIVLAGSSGWLAKHVINVEADKIAMANMAIVAQAVFIFFQIQASVETGVLSAYQRLDITYMLVAAGTVLQNAGAAILAILGYGLAGVVWWVALVQGVMWLAASWYAKKLQPHILHSISTNFIGWGARLFKYAGLMVAGFASGQLFVPILRIFMGTFRTMAEVAYFSVPANLASNLGVISNHVASSATPVASERSGCNDLSGLKALYLKSLRWSWMALVPLVGLTMALGSQFIGAWLGVEFGRAVEPFMCLLVFGMSLYLFSSVPYSMAQGMGRAGPWATIALGAGIINSVLAFFLIPQRGAQGAVEALGASSILLILAMLFWLNFILKVSWHEIFKYVVEIRILIVTSAVSLAAFVISSRFQPSLFWIILIGLAGASIILASFPLWLDSDERRWMQNKWRSLHIGSAQRL